MKVGSIIPVDKQNLANHPTQGAQKTTTIHGMFPSSFESLKEYNTFAFESPRSLGQTCLFSTNPQTHPTRVKCPSMRRQFCGQRIQEISKNFEATIAQTYDLTICLAFHGGRRTGNLRYPYWVHETFDYTKQ